VTQIIITHAVKDVEHWLKFHDERVEQLEGTGLGTGVQEHVAGDGSKNVAITMDVKDMGAMESAMANPGPEMGASMEKHGVIQPLSVYVAK